MGGERTDIAARKAAEATRLQRVKDQGFVPPDVGPEICEAPARGPVRVFDVMGLYPKGEDEFERKPMGHLGRRTLKRADVFDLMEAKAARHGKASPLTLSQVAMGRAYRDLVERHDCAGIKCSSIEGRPGGGADGSFMDAVLRDGRQVDLLRRRIGHGAALEVRRVRPSARGVRHTIADRQLVDDVCIADLSPTEVLRKYGWASPARSAKAEQIKALQAALGAALDRMCGPSGEYGVRSASFGSPAQDVWT